MSASRSEGTTVPKARFWGPVAVIGTAQFLVIMNNAIINIALPSLVADLGMSPVNQSWVVTSYLLAFGAMLVLGGQIGDSIGHRRALIIGLGVTAVAAIGAGLASAGWALLAWRSLQGAAAALVSPSAVALLSLTFADPALRRRAFGIYGAVTGAGGALGLIAGGVLTDAFSWRATMFVSVPFAIVAAVGALWLLPGARNTSKRQWNVRGAGLVVLGIGALLLTITRIGAKGAPLVGVIAGIVAVVCLSLFARAERTSANPVIPHGFFRSRDRSLGLLTVGVGALSMTGVFVILSVHMQGEMGLSALDTSIATLPYPVGMVVSTQLAPRLIGRFGAQRTAVTAMLVAAIGLAPLAWSGTHSYWSLMLPSLIFVSLAIGPAFVAGSQLAMSDVAAETSGVAGALMNSASEIGGAIGVAALSAASLSSLSLRPDAGSPGFGLAVLLATAFLLMGGMLGGVLNRRAPRLAR